jgi:acetyl esterase/lipase
MNLELETHSYSTRRGLVYARAEGRPLKMTLFVPENSGTAARPGIVLIHGGAWILGTRYQLLWYCRHFARAGFVVMTIDYRLMPRYAFPKCLHDSKAAVRWLRLHAEELNVDPDRIAAFGESAGGHLASFLAATGNDDRFEGTENPGASSAVRAAISLYGPVDLTCYRDLPSHGPLVNVTRRFMVDFSGREASASTETSWESASPIAYASSGTAPILFVHGEKDFVVHFEQSRRFHERLRELGVATRLLALPNRGHGFDYIRPRQRRAVFGEMLAFLSEHMKEDAPVTCPSTRTIETGQKQHNVPIPGSGRAG